MINPKSNQFREARMHNEAGCTWPKCQCTVPDYAMSGHNRVDYCGKLAELEKNMVDLGYPEDVFSMRSLLVMNGYPCSIDAPWKHLPTPEEAGVYWIDNEKLSMSYAQGRGFGFWTNISDEGYGDRPDKIILDVQEAFDEFKEQHVKRSQVSSPEKET